MAGQGVLQKYHRTPPILRNSEKQIINFSVDLEYLRDYPEFLVDPEGTHVQPNRRGIAPKFIFSKRVKFGNKVGKKAAWQLLLDPYYFDPADPTETRYLSAFLYMTPPKGTALEDFPPFIETYYHIAIKDPIADPDDDDDDEEDGYLHSKYSGLRPFTKVENVYGWQKFIEFDRLGNGSVTTSIDFRVSITVVGESLPPAEVEETGALLFPKELQVLNDGNGYDDMDKGASERLNQILQAAGGPFESQGSNVDMSRKNKLKALWNMGYATNPDAFILCGVAGSGQERIGIHKMIVAPKCLTIANYFASEGAASNTFACPKFHHHTVCKILAHCYEQAGPEDLPPLSTGMDADAKSALDIWDGAMFLGCEIVDKGMRTSRMLLPMRKGLVVEVGIRFILSEMVFRDNMDAGQDDFVKFLQGLNEGNPWPIFSDYYRDPLYYFKLLFRPGLKEIVREFIERCN